MYGKKSRGSKILETRGRGDFVKFFLAPPPKMRVAPQMPPPPHSETWRRHCLSLLSALSAWKAISARLLKECAEVIAPSLTELFNKLLTLGKVPTEWKHANIVPVPKTNETRVIN